MAGRRVRSRLPLRLYLSASVVYFLLLALPFFANEVNIKMTTPDRAAIDSSKAGDLTGRASDSTKVITFGSIDRAKIAASSI